MQVTSNETLQWLLSLLCTALCPLSALSWTSEGTDCISGSLLRSHWRSYTPLGTLNEVGSCWHAQKSAWKALHSLSDARRAVISPLSRLWRLPFSSLKAPSLLYSLGFIHLILSDWTTVPPPPPPPCLTLAYAECGFVVVSSGKPFLVTHSISH